MPYSEFAKKMNQQGVVMRADVEAVKLIEDLPAIHFLEDIADRLSAEVEQGLTFQSQPEYFDYE